MSADAGRQLDPRVERSRMVILRAAVGELADVGYGRVRIESIAVRAGVGKPRSTGTGPTSSR
jgi:AcrR family transcriptional regulator